mgnify:CR=1 FL=1
MAPKPKFYFFPPHPIPHPSVFCFLCTPSLNPQFSCFLAPQSSILNHQFSLFSLFSKFKLVSLPYYHKAESIWAGMTPKLESFISQGVDHFYICSDSTGAQYRNSKNAYFMKDFATKHKVKIDWIFTERHHGKSPADGIGGNVKNTVEQLTAFSTQHNIKNAEDVAYLLRSTDSNILVTNCVFYSIFLAKIQICRALHKQKMPIFSFFRHNNKFKNK